MKKLIAFAAALLLFAAPFATAADAPAAANKAPTAQLDKLSPGPAEACPQASMMGGGGMASAMSPDLVKKMQAQMLKIRQTSDPVEHQRLMREHFQSMQEAMQTMRGNMGMGGCMQCCRCQQHCLQPSGGSCARGKGPETMPPGSASQATQSDAMSGMMERRMDMMQMMMENMLEHQRQIQPNK